MVLFFENLDKTNYFQRKFAEKFMKFSATKLKLNKQTEYDIYRIFEFKYIKYEKISCIISHDFFSYFIL